MYNSPLPKLEWLCVSCSDSAGSKHGFRISDHSHDLFLLTWAIAETSMAQVARPAFSHLPPGNGYSHLLRSSCHARFHRLGAISLFKRPLFKKAVAVKIWNFACSSSCYGNRGHSCHSSFSLFHEITPLTLCLCRTQTAILASFSQFRWLCARFLCFHL